MKNMIQQAKSRMVLMALWALSNYTSDTDEDKQGEEHMDNVYFWIGAALIIFVAYATRDLWVQTATNFINLLWSKVQTMFG